MLPALLWLCSLLLPWLVLKFCARHWLGTTLRKGCSTGSARHTHTIVQAATLALALGAIASLLSVVAEAGLLRLQGLVFALLWQLGNISRFFAAWEDALRSIWLAFTAVALWEEAAKCVALCASLRLLASRAPQYDDISCADTIAGSKTRRKSAPVVLLLGLNLALGFSAGENLWYMLHYGNTSIYTRLLVTTPMHFCLGVVLSLRLEQVRRQGQCPAKALAGPILWHGAYNSALAIGPGTINWAALIVFVLLLLYSSAKLALCFTLPSQNLPKTTSKQEQW